MVTENSQVAFGGKLKPKFQGPFEVIGLPKERYVFRRESSRNMIIVAANEQLRSWPTNKNTAMWNSECLKRNCDYLKTKVPKRSIGLQNS